MKFNHRDFKLFLNQYVLQLMFYLYTYTYMFQYGNVFVQYLCNSLFYCFELGIVEIHINLS